MRRAKSILERIELRSKMLFRARRLKPDYENGKVITDFTQRAKTDQSLKGIKTMYREEATKALAAADEIIKNTYRTLMTRGMKGCYVYCVDNKLAEYLRKCLKKCGDK